MALTTAGDIVTRTAILLRRDDIDAEILEWLNMFLHDVGNEVDLPTYRFTDSIAATASVVSSVGLTQTNALRVEDIEIVVSSTDSRSLGIDEQMPIEEYWRWIRPSMNSTPSQGVPNRFAYDANENKVYFDRTFDTTNLTTLKIRGYRIPATVTTASTPEVPLHLRHHLIMGAYFYGKMYQEEDPEHLVLFDRGRRNAIAMMTRAQVQKERRGLQVRVPPSGLERADRIY